MTTTSTAKKSVRNPFKNLLKSLLLLGFILFGLQSNATHYVGSDITYKCTSANGDYKVTLVVYRDCGAPGGTATFCSGNCSNISACKFQVEVWGADPSCQFTKFFTFDVSGVSVRDVNRNPRCADAKNSCSNMGCVGEGSLTPGIERYEFEGTVNIGPSSGIPASCCNVRFSYRNCCRNGIIQNIQPNWFYTDAVVNRCQATYPDCNSPDLTNDPYAVFCAGQGSVYNNGAFDPDLDSLVYSFTASLEDYGQSAIYIAPYQPDIPLPYTPPLSGNYPYGIHIDALSGDIMFRPNVVGFTGVLALRMEQWRLINGVYVMVGVTRRDLQVYIKYCDPNTPPTLRTVPAGIPALKPKTKYEVCAGDQICFDVIAKDTDYLPPLISDTTFLSWNKVMENYGATFLPKYNPGIREFFGPREDIYQVCWTPQDIHCKRGQTTTYPFTIKAIDSRCPYPGQVLQGFSITVYPRPKVAINQIDAHCGYLQLSYTKDPSYIPPQVFQSTTWMISKNPNDFSFTGGAYSYSNLATTPMMHFTKGGNYGVELIINMRGPNGGFCSRSYRDTLHVDSQVVAVLRDTFVCKGNVINLTALGKSGQPPYTYRWFNGMNDTLTPLNGPFFQNPTHSVQPAFTRKYIIQVRDLNGCRYWDSLTMTVKQLPVSTMIDSTRICYGDTFTIDPGNNYGNIRGWKWNTGDTTQTISRTDSNTFIVTLTDTFGCQSPDTMALKVNARIMANAGLDTFICQKDTTTLLATGGTQFTWKNITNNVTLSTKSYLSWVRVNPTNTGVPTKYEVRVYQSYPDTTNKNLECSAVDTVVISVKPLPTLTKPTIPILACAGTPLVSLTPFGNIPGQQNGTGVWSYPRSPQAVINPLTGPGITTTPQVKVDSLKNLPTVDAIVPSPYTNMITYTYTEPVYGCTNKDSLSVNVFSRPKVDAGTAKTLCENSGLYDINITANLGARGVTPPQNQSATPTQYYWSGTGIDSVPSPTYPNKKYSFNPAKAGVLKLPAFNVITYKYYYIYSLSYPPYGNFTQNCWNQDTTRFYVTPTPTIDAGSEINICSNEPVFDISNKTGASINPYTGNTKWKSPVTTVNKGITSGTTFDASQVTPLPSGKQMLIYEDNTDNCYVADTTYISIVGSPSAEVYLSTGGARTASACLGTGNVDVWTKVNNTYNIGTTSQAIPENYSYRGSPAWSANPAAVPGNPNPPTAFFNTDYPGLIAGNHDLIFKIVQTNGTINCVDADTVTLTIQQPPTIDVHDGGALCQYGDPIAVVADISALTSMEWSSANGTFNDNAAPSTTFAPDSVSMAATGKVWIYGTTIPNSATDKCATARDSTQITIEKVPTAAFNCPDCDGCEPLTSSIYALPTGVPGATFLWTWDDGYTTNNADSAFARTVQDYGSDGNHPFRLTVRSGESQGCTAQSQKGTMIVRAKPEAGFTHIPEYTTVAKPYYNFVNNSSVRDNSQLSFVWDMGQFTGADPSSRILVDPNPKQVQFKEDTTLVKLTVTTEFGCWDTASTIVRVEPDITVFAPNAFYPNSGVKCPDDDLYCNRFFKIAATGYASVEIFVFNRWGQQVYYSTKAEEGWNGQINNSGAECPQDVYIYQVNATSFNGKLYKYSGSITLLR